MPDFNIKPTHKPIKNYYAELEKYAQHGVKNEGTVRAAFQDLLQHYCRQSNLTLLCEKTHYTQKTDVSNRMVKSSILTVYHTAIGKRKIPKMTSTLKQIRSLRQATPRKISSSSLRPMPFSISTDDSNLTLISPSRETSFKYSRPSSPIKRRISQHGILRSLNSKTRCRNSVTNWRR